MAVRWLKSYTLIENHLSFKRCPRILLCISLIIIVVVIVPIIIIVIVVVVFIVIISD